MDLVLLFARLALALVFLVAGVTKLLDRPGARQAIVDFGLSSAIAGPLAVLLPLGELAIALAILPTATAWWGTLLSLVLLAAFSVGIATNLARGRRPACHCFGQVGSGPIGWRTLLRNATLVLTAGLVLVLGPGASPFGLVEGLGRLTGFQAVALAGGAVGLGLLAGEAWFLLQLLAQNGRLLLRLEALEQRLGSGGGPQPATAPSARPVEPRAGGLAPWFALPDLTGNLVSLDTLRASGKPLLLVFTDPGCAPCGALLPDVARWQRERTNLAVVVVSRGSSESNRAKSVEHGLGLMLLQLDLEVAELYHAVGTPSAVLVRPDGTFASGVAAGAERIRALVARHSVETALDARVATSAAAHLATQSTHLVGGRIGQAAPVVELRDLTGGVRRLAEFHRRLLVLFWNPGCGFCQRMLDDLKAWEADPPAGAPRLVVVSTGSVEENLGMGLLSTVVLDDGFAAGRAFGATGTPSAVLVDEQGRIESDVVSGAPAVLALARTRRMPEKSRNGNP